MSEKIYDLEIFKGIPHDVIDHIINNCEERNYNKGEIILVEGAESNGEGYILKTGNVSISINGTKIAELNAGAIFGEIALLNEESRTATVTALANITTFVLTIDNLIEMINNDENKINKTIIQRIEENINR